MELVLCVNPDLIRQMKAENWLTLIIIAGSISGLIWIFGFTGPSRETQEYVDGFSEEDPTPSELMKAKQVVIKLRDDAMRRLERESKIDRYALESCASDFQFSAMMLNGCLPDLPKDHEYRPLIESLEKRAKSAAREMINLTHRKADDLQIRVTYEMQWDGIKTEASQAIELMR